MESGEALCVLFARLAWWLQRHDVDSWVSVRPGVGIHMHISSRRFQQDVVEATLRDEQWYLIWRGTSLNATDLATAADTIAKGLTA